MMQFAVLAAVSQHAAGGQPWPAVHPDWLGVAAPPGPDLHPRHRRPAQHDRPRRYGLVRKIIKKT